MVWFEVKLFGVLYLMTMFPMLTQAEPEEGVARRLLPSKRGSSFDSSNGVFEMFRPFWQPKEDETEQEDEERDISHDQAKQIWESVMDRVADDVPTTETRDEAKEQPSKIPSTMPRLPTEVDPKIGGSEPTVGDDVSQDVESTKAQPELDEPDAIKTEEEEKAFISPHREEESVPSKMTEEAPRSKRVQEETATRESTTQTVEALSHRPPIDAAEATSAPTENKNSHHIGHNLKVVTWTLAGVCLSVVVIGNFLGIYFSYIKPRMSQPTLL